MHSLVDCSPHSFCPVDPAGSAPVGGRGDCSGHSCLGGRCQVGRAVGVGVGVGVGVIFPGADHRHLKTIMEWSPSPLHHSPVQAILPDMRGPAAPGRATGPRASHSGRGLPAPGPPRTGLGSQPASGWSPLIVRRPVPVSRRRWVPSGPAGDTWGPLVASSLHSDHVPCAQTPTQGPRAPVCGGVPAGLMARGPCVMVSNGLTGEMSH